MDLWTLTVATRRGASLQFLFDRESPAKAAYDTLKERRGPEDSFMHERGLSPSEWRPECEVTDSYGVTATVDRSEVVLCWVSDLGREAEGKKQLALAQARANASANREAQADPMLRQAAPLLAPSTQLLGRKN